MAHRLIDATIAGAREPPGDAPGAAGPEAALASPGHDVRNPFSVLGHSQFRLLLASTTLMMIAFGMMQVAQGVVAFELTGKNSSVGFVSLGMGISMVVLGPIGGTLSDRFSKKLLLTITQAVTGLTFGVIGVLIAIGEITILFLAGATLVMGCMFSVMGPTRQAWVGDLLAGPTLSSGIALQQLMMNGTRIGGPVLAGVLIAIEPIGTAGTYFAMTGLFVLVVLVLLLMEPTPPRARERPTTISEDILGGFRYLWQTPDVRLLTLVLIGVVFSGFSYMTLMPGFLENALGQPASRLGMVYGTTAAGGIVTTLVLAARQPVNPGRAMLLFVAALAGSLVLLAMAPNLAATLGVAALIGASSSGFQMLNNVSLMERTQPEFLGRVMSVTMMAFGVNAMFAYAVGRFADEAGERTTLAILAVACLGVAFVGSLAVRSLQRMGSPAPPPAAMAMHEG